MIGFLAMQQQDATDVKVESDATAMLMDCLLLQAALSAASDSLPSADRAQLVWGEGKEDRVSTLGNIVPADGLRR